MKRWGHAFFLFFVAGSLVAKLLVDNDTSLSFAEDRVELWIGTGVLALLIDAGLRRLESDS